MRLDFPFQTGDWVRRDSGVGAGIDSYYEYVAKAYVLLGEDKYFDRLVTLLPILEDLPIAVFLVGG